MPFGLPKKFIEKQKQIESLKFVISVIRLNPSYPITIQFENGDTNDYYEEQIEIIDHENAHADT